MINKETIRKNFSKCAAYYDRHCAIQTLCALELNNRLVDDKIETILEIGCGTGNYTKLLKDRFPCAKIKTIDISYEMVTAAKNKVSSDRIEFVVNDAERIFLGEKFDLITSNAVFQWFDDLESALLRYQGILNKRGRVLFSLFGSLTFFELNKALDVYLGEAADINSQKFFTQKTIEEILRKIFKKSCVKKEIFKENYGSLVQLLKQMKYTGVRGEGVSKLRFWTPKKIADLEKIYKDEFGGIDVTYEVFFCQGVK